MATIDPAVLLNLLTGIAGVEGVSDPAAHVSPVITKTNPAQAIADEGTGINATLKAAAEVAKQRSPEPVQATSSGPPAPASKPVPKTAAGGQKDVARVLQKLGLEDVPDAVDAEQDPRLQALRGKKGGLEQSRADLLKRADEPTSTGDLIGQALVGLLPGLLGLGIGGAVAGTHGAAAGAAGGFSGAAEGLGKLQQTKREDKAKLVQRAEQEGDRAEKIEGMEGQRTDTLEGRSLAAQEAARVRNQHAGQFNAAQENDDIEGEKSRGFQAGENAKGRAQADRHLAAQLRQRDVDSYRDYLAKVAGQKASAIKPTDAQKSFYSNVDGALKAIQQLRETVGGKDGKGGHGNYENAMLGDPKALADIEGLPYLIAVNTAKILDPATAAREGEVQAGQKYLVKTGLFTKNGTTLADLDMLEKMIKNKATEMNGAFGDPIPENATGSAPKVAADGLKGKYGF